MSVLSFFKKISDGYFRGPLWALPPAVSGARQGDSVKDQVDTIKKRRFFYTLFFWVKAWCERITSKPLRLILIVFVILLYLFLLLPRLPVREGCYLLAGIFILDIVGGFIFFPKLKIQRQFPERVRCNVPFQVSYQLSNKRRLPALDMTLDPGLVDLNFLRRCGSPAFFSLFPKEDLRITHEYLAHQRGIYTVPQSLAVSTFPFNLWNFSTSNGGQSRLVVHPYYCELEPIPMISDTRLQQKHHAADKGHVGESTDFFSCRDFHYGDPINRIAWKVSAKYQKLIVKEFQAEYLSRAAVILDNRKKTALARTGSARDYLKKIIGKLNTDLYQSDIVFEALVSLGTSVTYTLRKQDYYVNIYAAGSEIHHFPVGKNDTDDNKILDLLSSIKQVRKNVFDSTGSELSREISSIGNVFLLLLEADGEAFRFYQSLLFARAGVRVILLCRELPEKLPQWVSLAVTPEMVFTGKVKIS